MVFDSEVLTMGCMLFTFTILRHQFAGFEFPGVVSSSPITAKRKEKLSNWFRSLFADFENAHHNRIPISKMDKHISELIKGTKAISEKDAIIASISRFGLTLLFALSTSMAVLRNTYLHFQSLLEDKCSEIEDKDKNEALQMIHFQFAKIYDLQHACQSIERLFRNLASRGHAKTQNRSKKTKRRRLNRPSVATGKTVRQLSKLVLMYLDDFTLLTCLPAAFQRIFKYKQNWLLSACENRLRNFYLQQNMYRRNLSGFALLIHPMIHLSFPV